MKKWKRYRESLRDEHGLFRGATARAESLIEERDDLLGTVKALNDQTIEQSKQLREIRRVAHETPEPTLAEVCIYCRHNPTEGLHAPGCAWNELLRVIGVANETEF